jgi:hypothetical protein
MGDEKTLKVESISDNPLLNNENSNSEKPVVNDHIQKILKEKKNAMDKLRDIAQENEILKAKLSELEEQELLKNKQFEQLADTRKKEAEEWRNKYTESQNLIKDSVKKASIKSELNKLGIEEKYISDTMKLIDLNEVVYDEETRVVSGAEQVALRIKDKFPPLFGQKNVGVSHDAPSNGNLGRITLEEWKKLPVKEQRERLPELYANLGVKR